MSENALISVIVPIYNVEKYLPACVDSLLAQTYRNLQIILVDDGSPDGCGKMCDQYAALDERILVIHKENGGLSSARNAGIDAAQGEYLAFCDSDDTMLPDALESMLRAAVQQDVPMVCAGRYDVNESDGIRVPGLCPETTEIVTGQELVRRIFTWDHLDSAAWDKLYRAELFQDIRYPVGKVIEDIPTTYKIALRAGKALLLAKPVYCYLHRGNSITTASVSGKTLHYTENVHNVYRDILAVCPELEPEARFLKACSLVYTVQSFDAADPELSAPYADRVAVYRHELRQELPFILKNRRYSWREKLEDIVLAFNLYRVIRSVKRRLAGKK